MKIKKKDDFEPSPKKQSVGNQVSEVVTHVLMATELFHDKRNVAYARVKIGNAIATMTVASDQCRRWIKSEWFGRTDSVLSENSVKEVVEAISAHAQFRSSERLVHRRIARNADAYYIDTGDKRWRVIRVDRNGWAVLTISDVLFERSATAKELPRPMKNGNVKSLLRFLRMLNIPKSKRVLVIAWLIESLRAGTDFPGLALIGRKGSFKSGAQSNLRDMVDPNVNNLLAAPSGIDDMKATANNNHLISYENLSSLSVKQQDALCIMATGGAISAREKFSDGAEVQIEMKRPVILNGISRVVTRDDLLDRFICLDLPRIDPGEYKPRSVVQANIDAVKPAAFGALLDIFVKALQLLPNIEATVKSGTRMSDFALLGEAVARSMGKKGGYFLSVYASVRSNEVGDAIGASPVGAAVRGYIAANPRGISGTYDQIGPLLKSCLTDKKLLRDWPGSGRAFGDAMTRIEGTLEQIGISVSRKSRNTGTVYTIGSGTSS